jgi:hypothetical protein
MAIKSRSDLKGLFMNGSRPSQKDFAKLIDSMLNKRDDAFMGKWKAGVVYRTGDVVVHDGAIWVVPYDRDGNEQEICSKVEPGDNKEWDSLIVPISDNDWEADEETGVMYAKVFGCIGIGAPFLETGNIPEAKLDIIEEEKSRYMILPKPVDVPTLSLVQLGEGPDKTYFLTGLDNTQVGFTSDAPTGFIFRHGMFCEEGEEAELDFRDGDILMVIQPMENGLARVGISTATPEAMLDITDQSKGQFLFNPEDKQDPAFTIVNLHPETEKNYLATGVGTQWATYVSDAPKGFIFRHGADYGNFCAHEQVDQGKGLMVIRFNDKDQPRVGIGTEEPCAMLDVTDQEKGRFVLRPEEKDAPLFNIIRLSPENAPPYLATGLAARRAEWMTNAKLGFAFKIGGDYDDPCTKTDLADGKAKVVILPNGRVGIGVEDPSVRLEVSDERQSGRFLFNLDDRENTPNPALSIVNVRPEISNYLTLGASNDTSIFISNAPYGFSFRTGGQPDENDNHINIDQYSETLLNIRPETKEDGTVYPKELRIFPEEKGQRKGEVHIKGKVGIFRSPKNYELDVKGNTRSYGLYLNTDTQKMDEVAALRDVLDRVLRLRPVSFKWDISTGIQGEGTQFGLLAHEVEDVFSEVVKTTPRDSTEDQTKSVAYQNLVPVLVQAIKEQQDIINDLKLRIEALENAGS